LRNAGPWTYSFAEAKGWRIRTLAKRADGISILPPRSVPTIAEASPEFLTRANSGLVLSRNRKPYAPKTVRGYEQAFRDWIIPALGDLRITELKRSDVQRFVDGLASVRAGGTTRNITHALAALYSHLLPRYAELGNDPTLGIEKPRPGEPRKRYAEPGEQQALLRALPHDLAIPYALAFFAGLRHGEIQALPIDSIDLDSGWIDVRFSLDPKSGFRGPKGRASGRSVPIHSGHRFRVAVGSFG
jgi:integrase